MTTLDLSPLMRSTVGFDHLWKLLETALELPENGGYPPYNIEKLGEERYRIVMAVAGFRPEDLEIISEPNLLTVRGKRKEEGDVEYLHRGIAARAFERRFQLADYVKVREAQLKDGLLVIELEREVPEALRPRRIEIKSAAEAGRPVLEGQAEEVRAA